MKNKLMLWLFSMVLNYLKKNSYNFYLVEFQLQKFFEWVYKTHPVQFFATMKRIVREKKFVREIKQVDVKKGKRRYTLLFVTTLEGTTRINLGLGRHIEVPAEGQWDELIPA